MAYRFPKPPPHPIWSKEKAKKFSDDWDKMEERSFKIQSIGISIAAIGLLVLCVIILWAKFIK